MYQKFVRPLSSRRGGTKSIRTKIPQNVWFPLHQISQKLNISYLFASYLDIRILESVNKHQYLTEKLFIFGHSVNHASANHSVGINAEWFYYALVVIVWFVFVPFVVITTIFFNGLWSNYFGLLICILLERIKSLSDKAFCF